MKNLRLLSCSMWLILTSMLIFPSSTVAQKNTNPDLTNAQLRAFDEFLDSHPQIAADLQKKPSLVNDPGYLKAHGALAEFLRQHPGIKEEISENPGYFMKREKGVEGIETAPSRDEVRAFDQFLDSHPNIDNDLKKDPMLGVNGGYLQAHAELNNFFKSHQAVYLQYSRNPAAFMNAERGLESQEKGAKVGPQPHMEAALQHLKEAKKELESAGRDKGGHRENAISLTDKAEGEVEAGIQYAIQHAQQR